MEWGRLGEDLWDNSFVKISHFGDRIRCDAEGGLHIGSCTLRIVRGSGMHNCEMLIVSDLRAEPNNLGETDRVIDGLFRAGASATEADHGHPEGTGIDGSDHAGRGCEHGS